MDQGDDRAWRWLALATAIIGGCAPSGEGSVQIGPFGKWITSAGHTLTVNVDGTYRICKADSCSSGTAVLRGESYLEAVLRDFLAKPEAADLVPVISECLELHDSLTGGAVRRGLSVNDLPFDTVNNVLDGSKATQVVSFDCTEGVRRVEFVKVETFQHPALADQQAKLAKPGEPGPPTIRP